ncbi:MAG TPA: energy transducer TonB [Gemmatimonadales bacterium]|nr:energy transducer TonB [Gemmatimonadales bacterium]
MTRAVVAALGVLGIGAASTRAQEVTRSRGSRFDWSPVRVLVISDPKAGVELFLFVEDSESEGFQRLNAHEQLFIPSQAVAWVAAAESSLADTSQFHPVTLMARDSSTLVIVRGRAGEAPSGRAVLAYYPPPDTGDPKPLDIQVTLEQARDFLDAFRVRSQESHYDATAPPPDSTLLNALALIQPHPELLSAPPVQYPEEMRSQGLEGTVELRVMVDTLGRVQPGSIQVLSSPADAFTAEAKRMILKARFRPARLNGRAVRALINVPVRFALTHH